MLRKSLMVVSPQLPLDAVPAREQFASRETSATETSSVLMSKESLLRTKKLAKKLSPRPQLSYKQLNSLAPASWLVHAQPTEKDET